MVVDHPHPGDPPVHSQRCGGSQADMRKAERPARRMRSDPVDDGPSRPSGDTVAATMWGAHSGHRCTIANRSHATSRGTATSKDRTTAGLRTPGV